MTSTAYSIYSTDYDSSCYLCQQGQHQSHSTQVNQATYMNQNSSSQQNFSQSTQLTPQANYSTSRTIVSPQIQTQIKQLNFSQQSPQQIKVTPPTQTYQYSNFQMPLKMQQISPPRIVTAPTVQFTPPKQQVTYTQGPTQVSYIQPKQQVSYSQQQVSYAQTQPSITYTQAQPQYTQINNIEKIEPQVSYVQTQPQVNYAQQQYSQINNIEKIEPQVSYVQTQPQVNYAQQQYSQTNNVEKIEQKSLVTQVHNVEHLPLIHEIHHIERPVQVVGIEEVEMPWKAKVIVLEKQLIELELLIKKGGNKVSVPETKQVIVEDVNMIRKLESEIEEIEFHIQGREKLIMNADAEIERLRIELENSENVEEVTILEGELSAMKAKFIDLNKRFHHNQEELMLKQAEADSLRKKKTIISSKVITSSQRY